MSESTQESSSRPTRESLEYMKYLQRKLGEVQKDIPQVRALAFLGSRTRGQERKDPSRPSDLDTVVFYDGSEYTGSGDFSMFDSNGNVIPDFIQKNEKHQNDKRMHTLLKGKIKETFGNLMQERGLPVELYADYTGIINGSVILEDISQSATDRALELFQMFVDVNKADREIPLGTIQTPAFPLASRFLLGVGEELYRNRAYILDKLKEMQEENGEGEKYFQALMNCLKDLHDEGKIQKRKLPQSIQEARTFFKIK